MQKIKINGTEYLGTMKGKLFIGIKNDNTSVQAAYKRYLCNKHTGDLLAITISANSSLITFAFTEREAIDIKRIDSEFKRLIPKAQANMEANYFVSNVD